MSSTMGTSEFLVWKPVLTIFSDMDDGDLSLARRFTIKFHSMRKLELKYQTFARDPHS